MQRFLLATILLISTGCGAVGGAESAAPSVDTSVPTGLAPIISTITPNPAAIGATVTVTGFGFSSVSPSNILTIGGQSAIADAGSYALVIPATATSIESLTFTVPAGTPVGVQTVFLTVVNMISNADLTLTVTP